ncbi:DUF302 domain-containing protein [Herminiimonas fonticola]|uniref:DUF302 domain-containing protein n=1 Tax=Herminiimonas fonticola TaxID=303380 RepID=UPI0033404E2A
MKILKWTRDSLLIVLLLQLCACGTLHAINNTEAGAGTQALDVWDRWVESEGDIAAATTWSRKVKDGISIAEVEQAFDSVAAEDNIKSVGQFHLSRELELRTGKPQLFLKVYSFCSPIIARKMIDFSPHMAAYMPCRLTIVEKEDGLWIYSLNMDMLLGMGRKMPPDLRASVHKVRDTIWKMMERGALGEF